MRMLLALMLVATQCGCYQYSTVQLETIAPDDMIRVNLNPAGKLRLDSMMAANPWFSAGSLLTSGLQPLDPMVEGALQGRLVEPVKETLEVNMQHANAGDRLVVIPRDHVSRVDRRRLDVLRTAGLVGGGFGLAALILSQLHLGGRAGASGNDLPPADPFPLRIPLSFPLPN